MTSIPWSRRPTSQLTQSLSAAFTTGGRDENERDTATNFLSFRSWTRRSSALGRTATPSDTSIFRFNTLSCLRRLVRITWGVSCRDSRLKYSPRTKCWSSTAIHFLLSPDCIETSKLPGDTPCRHHRRSELRARHSYQRPKLAIQWSATGYSDVRSLRLAVRFRIEPAHRHPFGQHVPKEIVRPIRDNPRWLHVQRRQLGLPFLLLAEIQPHVLGR